MDIKEKILLIELLLRDIRGDWTSRVDLRARLAALLCREVADYYHELITNLSNYNTTFAIRIEQFKYLANRCISFSNFKDPDGRFFRAEFPYGYEGMDRLHPLTYTFNDKSDEFKSYIYKFLNHPSSKFDDSELVIQSNVETEDELHAKEIVLAAIKQKIIDMVGIAGVKDIIDDGKFPTIYYVEKIRDWITYSESRDGILGGWIKFHHELETDRPDTIRYDVSIGDYEIHNIQINVSFALGTCQITMFDTIDDPEILNLFKYTDNKFDELIKKLDDMDYEEG